MSDADHQKLAEKVLAWAKEQLALRGRIEFTVFTIDEQQREATAAADPACFAGDGGRERLARNMRKQFRKAGIVRYAIVAECWLTRPGTPAGPLRKLEIGRDRGGREEVVIVHVCDRGSASIHVSAIRRDLRTGQATGLRELVATDGTESLLEGRFTNLLEGRIHG
jgi:hypothetical protein